MKRIAVDLAKSVYQVAESVHSDRVGQRKRLSREAFRRYIQKQSANYSMAGAQCPSQAG